MTRLLFAAIAAVLLEAGCSGGGGSAPIAAIPTSAPTIAPTSTPTQAPTSTPTQTPTTAPTQVPLLQRVIGGAPVTATLSQLQSRVRSQAHTQAQGVTNGLPILVESSGMVAAWAGDQAVWSSAVGGGDIAETGLTVTPSTSLPINNPGPQPISCLGSVSAMCAVHPLAWTFGTSSANGKTVGKSTITVAFADGTSGTTFDYVYDGWTLPCNAGWVYQGGVPVATTVKASSDIYADCVNGNIDFPGGGALVLANPSQDQYGRYETIMPTLTAAPIIATLNGQASMASISQGLVLAIQTHDGSTAKVFFTGGASSTTVNSASGMSLHANLSGAYDF